MFIAVDSERRQGDFISIVDIFSTSNDDRDFPKYLNMRFDFCDDVVEIPESEEASVKFSPIFVPSLSGFLLYRISDVRMIRIITANVAPVPIATSNRSPWDSPSIDTFGTVGKNYNIFNTVKELLFTKYSLMLHHVLSQHVALINRKLY